MNIKKIKPLFSQVLVTKDVYTADETTGSLITKASGTVKEDQRVIAVGEFVKCVKEGDLVHIDPRRYAVKKYQEDSVKADLMTNQTIGYDIPQVMIDGRNYLLIEDRDIKYVIEEFEEDKPDSGLIRPNTDIIL